MLACCCVTTFVTQTHCIRRKWIIERFTNSPVWFCRGRWGSDLCSICGVAFWLIHAMSLAYFLWCQQELSTLICMLGVYPLSKKSGMAGTQPEILCKSRNRCVCVCVWGELAFCVHGGGYPSILSPFSFALLLLLSLHLPHSLPSVYLWGGFVLTEAVCARHRLCLFGRGAARCCEWQGMERERGKNRQSKRGEKATSNRRGEKNGLCTICP